MGVYGLRDLRTFWDEQHDTKALLAWSHSAVVIAFRGTQSVRNAWSDVQVNLCQHHAQCPLLSDWLKANLSLLVADCVQQKACPSSWHSTSAPDVVIPGQLLEC